MHRDLACLLADDQHHRSCPCEAVPEHPYELHKCHARMIRRRHAVEGARRATRPRRRGRQARKRACLAALTACSLRTNRAGG
jgi:hypothetical protein